LSFAKQQISHTLDSIKFDEAGQNLKTKSPYSFHITAFSSTINVYYRNISKVDERQMRLR